MKSWKGKAGLAFVTCLAAIVMIAGCSGEKDGEKEKAVSSSGQPSFTIAASEYPSWSTLFVAHRLGLINSEEGKLGPIEQKWKVDIVVKEADYDTCLTLYGSGTVDADCHTNIDALAPALGRPSVVFGPTSTSVGADATITVGVTDIDDLKNFTTYGLEKSVAHFSWYATLVEAGKDPKDYTFKNMDPAAAAQAMQTSQENINAIQVWNPFVMQTLRTRSGTSVTLTSAKIPEQIVDAFVIGKDVLAKPGGENFACALLDTFYQVNEALGPALGKKGETLDEAKAETLVAGLTDAQRKALVSLGDKFSNLSAEDMAICTHQTVFYRNADEGIALFNNTEFQTKTTPFVTKFCADFGIVDKTPTVSFGDYKQSSSQLTYDTQFMQRVKDKK